MRFGSLELTLVQGGRLCLDGGAMFGVVPKTLWERKSPADERNRVRLASNCLLVRGEGWCIFEHDLDVPWGTIVDEASGKRRVHVVPAARARF